MVFQFPKLSFELLLQVKILISSKKNLFSKLQNKNSVDKLIKTLSQRYQKRNGGYCRIIKAGFRYGDNAPMAIIEFVDRDVAAKRVDRKKVKTEDKSKVQTPAQKTA